MTAAACIDGTCQCRTCKQAKPCTDFPVAVSKRGHRLYCSTCDAERRRHGRFPEAPPNATCYWCGTRFHCTDIRQRCCSYACGNAARHKPDVSRVYLRNCKQCKRPFASRSGIIGFCGDTCRSASKAYKRDERCPDCGDLREFLQTYCAPCRRRRLRASRKVGKHQRRAREHGALRERVDPLTVYERDGWCCGICRKPVDRGLAWPDPMSPSLDHVVPLAMNGSHTYLNTQLAHLRCNMDKSASPPRVRGKERPDQVLF